MFDLLTNPRPRKHGERGVIGGLMALSFIGSLRLKSQNLSVDLRVVNEKGRILTIHDASDQSTNLSVLDDDDDNVEH